VAGLLASDGKSSETALRSFAVSFPAPSPKMACPLRSVFFPARIPSPLVDVTRYSDLFLAIGGFLSPAERGVD
jgi:hypothetical protein